MYDDGDVLELASPASAAEATSANERSRQDAIDKVRELVLRGDPVVLATLPHPRITKTWEGRVTVPEGEFWTVTSADAPELSSDWEVDLTRSPSADDPDVCVAKWARSGIGFHPALAGQCVGVRVRAKGVPHARPGSIVFYGYPASPGAGAGGVEMAPAAMKCDACGKHGHGWGEPQPQGQPWWMVPPRWIFRVVGSEVVVACSGLCAATLRLRSSE